MTAFITIDVEDWFHTANFQNVLTRDEWGSQKQRVDYNTKKILEIFDSAGVKGTFFVLGWVAKKYPELVPEIANRGHEIASHGTNHQLVYSLSKEEFREDITSSKKILEDQTGQEVIGYRAPNFSITDSAIDILQEAGFKYDSSVFPTIFHDRYGKLDRYKVQNKTCYEIKSSFYEVPMSCYQLFGKNLPWAGGAYFRLFPFSIFKYGFKQTLKKEGSFNFYLHPWEIDDTVKDDNLLSGTNKFRQTLNLTKTEGRLKKLVDQFRFQPIKAHLKELS